MNIQFDEIGQIIAIGAFFIISICILLRHSEEMKSAMTFLITLKLPTLFVSAVFLAFLYSVGILVQSVSKNTVALRKPQADYLIPDFLLPCDYDMRAASFDKFYDRRTPWEEKIIKEVSKKFLEKDFPSDKYEKSRLFFAAKNRIFNRSDYYPELKSIESKLFFTTSLTFSAWILLLLYITILIYKAVKNKAYKKENREGYSKKYLFEYYYIILLTFLLFAGSLSYRSIQDSFNFRVFGYYISFADRDNDPSVPRPNNQ